MLSLSLKPAIQTTLERQTLTLPDEMFLLILHFLPPKDLSSTCLVCRDWKDLSIKAGSIYYRNVTVALGGKMTVNKSGLKAMRSYALLFQKRASASKGADNHEKWDALVSIATHFVNMGDVFGALETLKLISDDTERLKRLFTILTHLVQLPDEKAALEVAHTMPDDFSKASALSFISEDLAGKMRLDLALKIANEALQLIQNSSEQSPHMGRTLQTVSEAFLTISEQFAKIGAMDRALPTNRKALEAVRLIEEKTPLAQAHLSVSKSLVVIGMEADALLIANEALDAANLIVDDPFSPKSSILLDVCRQFISLSEVEKAQTLADTIQSPRNRSRALLDVSKAHAELGDLESALSSVQRVLQLIDQERNPSRMDSTRFLTCSTFSYISKIYKGKGEMERADDTTRVAKDLANKIRNVGLKHQALSDISKKLSWN